jgi:uncharacterized membrane protein YkvA (DUF1232 family)
MTRTLLIAVAALVALWLAFAAIVYALRPDQLSLREALRLLPDTIRLVRRLATDKVIPRRTRWMLWLLLGYLASPIDLVPDFIPVIGYADDAIITSLVIRHLVRKAGSAKVREHWPGSPEGLAALERVLRLPTSS